MMKQNTLLKRGSLIWRNTLNERRQSDSLHGMPSSEGKTLRMSRSVTDSILRLCERLRRSFHKTPIRHRPTDSLILPQGVIANYGRSKSLIVGWEKAFNYLAQMQKRELDVASREKMTTLNDLFGMGAGLEDLTIRRDDK